LTILLWARGVLALPPPCAHLSTSVSSFLFPPGRQLIMGADRVFSFDNVLDPSRTQEDCYTVCAVPLLEPYLGGFNSTLMAYGQTGTGQIPPPPPLHVTSTCTVCWSSFRLYPWAAPCLQLDSQGLVVRWLDDERESSVFESEGCDWQPPVLLPSHAPPHPTFPCPRGCAGSGKTYTMGTGNLLQQSESGCVGKSLGVSTGCGSSYCCETLAPPASNPALPASLHCWSSGLRALARDLNAQADCRSCRRYDAGILPRVIRFIFDEIEGRKASTPGATFSVRIQFLVRGRHMLPLPMPPCSALLHASCVQRGGG
jgi:hypothetical protein